MSSSLSLLSQIDSVADVASTSANTISPDSQSSVSSSHSLQTPGYSVADVALSSSTSVITVIQIHASSAPTYTPNQPSLNASSRVESDGSFASVKASSLTRTTHYPTTSPRISTYVPSKAPHSYENATRTSSAWNSTITSVFRGQCTGCALAALNPVTTSYQSDLFGNWTSLVVTETILTEFVTYIDNSTIDTVVTETKTINQTKTVDGWITDTAAEFAVYLPTPGLVLTLGVGPTYVIYTSLFGGPDARINATVQNNATHSELKPTQSTCRPHVPSLIGWQPTRTQDWDFFVQTFANDSTLEPTVMDSPVPVPTKLQSFLAQDPDLQAHFQGADIATCTLAEISEGLVGDPSRTFNPSGPPSAPVESSAQPTATATTQSAATSASLPTFSSVPGTNTFLSTTYASTSKHITKQGCLRCDTKAGDRPQTPQPTGHDPNTNKINDDPVPTKSPNPKNDDTPKSNDKPNSGDSPKTDGKPLDQTQNTPQTPPKSGVKTTPSIPDFISSIILNNPNLTRKPQEPPTDSGPTITIGDSVVTVKPQSTKQGQGGPNQQTNAPTMVIIGTQTVTVGQTTMINGVPVVVPTAGRGSTIVVGDKTITIDPRTTQAPVPILTVGHSTITANAQGQFVVGSQTLQRGGPVLTLSDHTLTLGPNGKIAIWNSAMQTLATMAGPSGASAVTFGGHSITAKLLGGTTVFVLGDKTLVPGSAVTVYGTTFSLPSGFHGSSIVINGETQRLSAGLPALTINNLPITATVTDGTTEFIIAPDQTLTPGGVLTVSGTTYSLPTAGQGSTVVINGATSRLNPSHLPILSLSSEEVTATVARGTTAFIFGPDQTLTPGDVVTVSGTTFSLPASASGSVVVINGVTSTLDPESGVISTPPIVVDGKTITATTRDGTTEYVLNSATTLLPGGQLIVDGTTYSLAPGGTALIVNGKTSIISSTPTSNSASTTSSRETTSSVTTSERSAGDFISSGIGESSGSRGAGARAYGRGTDKWVESLVMGVAGWLLWLL